MKKIIITALALFSMNAHAATATGNFNATSQLSATCKISLLTANMDIGWITPTKIPMTVTYQSYILLQCTKTTPYVVKVSTGHGTYSQRFMKNAGDTDKLNYQLYQDNMGSKVLGDGTLGTFHYSGTSTGVELYLNIEAHLTNNQFVTPGRYSDTLTMTVEY